MKKRNKKIMAVFMALTLTSTIVPAYSYNVWAGEKENNANISVIPQGLILEKENIDTVSYTHLDVYKRQIYIWCQCNQSDLISGGFITFSEERCIRNRNIFSGLCAFLFNINQWPFHIYTDNMSKLVGWLYFRGSSKNIHKLVFSKRCV